MSRHARRLSGRHFGIAVLLALALATAGRVVQLASAPGEMPVAASTRAGRPPHPNPLPQIVADAALSGGQPATEATIRGRGSTAASELEAELARLYLACPASTVVDLDEVIQCAARESAGGSKVGDESSAWMRRGASVGVPRVAYPVPVHVATAPPPTSVQPIAEGKLTAAPENVPRVRYPVAVRVADRGAVERIAIRLRGDTGARGALDADRWLVDPNEWYTPTERQVLGGGTETVEETAPAEAEDRADDQPAVVEPVEDDATEDTGPVFERPGGGAAGTGDGPARFAPMPEAPVRIDQDRDVTPVGPGAVFAPPPGPPPIPSPSAPLKSGLAASAAAAEQKKQEDPHCELIARNRFPSARECAKCHEKIYEEWSSSSHAYAGISPMFHKFEQKISDLSRGTIGYFCYRCHAPVAVSMCESRIEPLWNLAEVEREGVTCIACHRVQYRYAKTNGERRIEEGPIFAPVFGGIGGDGVAEVIHHKDKYKVNTSPDEKGPGQDIHTAGIYFDQLGKSEFCVSCHQVAVHPGIKLEVVWEQYRASPACKKGIRCQDCHMGRIPGVPSGFDYGPAAVVADKKVNENRRHSNHIFYGPGYSIAHPGIFPHHLKANRWKLEEWLLFDWRAGWGTDDFEDAVADGQLHVNFPQVWKESDDRCDAREIIDDNFKKLAAKREIRQQLMENGSHVDGPYFDSGLCRGEDLRFHYVITNTNEGHNLPSGSLGAQPQLWANVVLIAPDGRRLWESGYTDSYGDVADIHSVDVRNKRVPFDWQLFNLQTMFLITGVKGTDREFYLPVNVDFDQLPFIRPGAIPISVTNHPPFIRMEGRSLSPLGSRKVPYRVPAELMRQPGVYRLSFRMRNRAEPIYFMRFVGATVEMQRAMNEWMVDVHPYSVEFVVK